MTPTPTITTYLGLYSTQNWPGSTMLMKSNKNANVCTNLLLIPPTYYESTMLWFNSRLTMVLPFTYTSASKTSLRTLNPVFHSALCLTTGAFPITPVTNLYALCNTLSPALHWIHMFFGFAHSWSLVTTGPCLNVSIWILTLIHRYLILCHFSLQRD